MEANVIVNLVTVMAKFQKTGKQSNSPQTKQRNRERLFTQHINQEFFTYPQTGLTSGMHRHVLSHTQNPLLSCSGIRECLSYSSSFRSIKFRKAITCSPLEIASYCKSDLFFQNSEIAEVIQNYICLAKCVLWILNSSNALGKVE